MSKMFVGCRKCGQPMEVDQQMVRNAVALGEDLVVEHDLCPGEAPRAPGEPEPERRFRVQVLAFELPDGADANQLAVVDLPRRVAVLGDGSVCEVLAGVGHTAAARNFPEAVNGPLTNWLAGGWATFQENAAYADLPPPAPQR